MYCSGTPPSSPKINTRKGKNKEAPGAPQRCSTKQTTVPKQGVSESRNSESMFMSKLNESFKEN
jgi:hypothetical protein